MKRLMFVSIMTALIVGACMPAATQPLENPTPVSEADLQLTAAVLSQQTLQALPTNTVPPSSTPVVNTVTASPEVTATETSNPALETLTATLLALGSTSTTSTITTGTVDTSFETGTPGTLVTSSTATLGTPQPLAHGTLPPNLPSGTIILFNKSHVEAYISLRCVTKEGYVTYLEYPVKKNFSISAPAGQYTYVAWVGGRQFSGGFSLALDASKTITFNQDKIHITK